MVAGHLSVKKGYYYCVLNYKDEYGKRKNKWISTGLPEKGNKKRAEEILIEEIHTEGAPCDLFESLYEEQHPGKEMNDYQKDLMDKVIKGIWEGQEAYDEAD